MIKRGGGVGRTRGGSAFKKGKIRRQRIREKTKKLDLPSKAKELIRKHGLGSSYEARSRASNELQLDLLRGIGYKNRNVFEERIFRLLKRMLFLKSSLWNRNCREIPLGEAIEIYNTALYISNRMLYSKNKKEFRKSWRNTIKGLTGEINDLRISARLMPEWVTEVEPKKLLSIANSANDIIARLKPKCSMFARKGFGEIDRAVKNAFAGAVK